MEKWSWVDYQAWSLNNLFLLCMYLFIYFLVSLNSEKGQLLWQQRETVVSEHLFSSTTISWNSNYSFLLIAALPMIMECKYNIAIILLKTIILQQSLYCFEICIFPSAWFIQRSPLVWISNVLLFHFSLHKYVWTSRICCKLETSELISEWWNDGIVFANDPYRTINLILIFFFYKFLHIRTFMSWGQMCTETVYRKVAT